MKLKVKTVQQQFGIRLKAKAPKVEVHKKIYNRKVKHNFKWMDAQCK